MSKQSKIKQLTQSELADFIAKAEILAQAKDFKALKSLLESHDVQFKVSDGEESINDEELSHIVAAKNKTPKYTIGKTFFQDHNGVNHVVTDFSTEYVEDGFINTFTYDDGTKHKVHYLSLSLSAKH